MEIGTHITGWQDMIEWIIAVWIVFSPYALGFFGTAAAGLTAVMLGSLAIVFSQRAFFQCDIAGFAVASMTSGYALRHRMAETPQSSA